jgi:hypothetical protein
MGREVAHCEDEGLGLGSGRVKARGYTEVPKNKYMYIHTSPLLQGESKKASPKNNKKIYELWRPAYTPGGRSNQFGTP